MPSQILFFSSAEAPAGYPLVLPALPFSLSPASLRYRVEQYKVIIDVLGGYSKHLEKSVRKLIGARARNVLEWMQKSVISNTLHIARTFKINT